MSFSSKDLTYIRVAIKTYVSSLVSISEGDCRSENEFSEIQDDILYLGRLLALVNSEILNIEKSGPSLGPVRSDD